MQFLRHSKLCKQASSVVKVTACGSKTGTRAKVTRYDDVIACLFWCMLEKSLPDDRRGNGWNIDIMFDISYCELLTVITD